MQSKSISEIKARIEELKADTTIPFLGKQMQLYSNRRKLKQALQVRLGELERMPTDGFDEFRHEIESLKEELDELSWIQL